MARLESALAAVCGDFSPGVYAKVLEGYLFLQGGGTAGSTDGITVDSTSSTAAPGSPGDGGGGGAPAPAGAAALPLGAEVRAAFVSVVGGSAAKVVRGVLLTRAGCEERAAAASGFHVSVGYPSLPVFSPG